MEDKARGILEARVAKAAVLRTMCQTQGFKLFKQALDDKIADLKNRWLRSDDDESHRIRLRAQVYNEIFDELKKTILEGDNAARTLRTEFGDSDE